MKFVRVICEDLLQERWRLMTRRRLNRRAVVVDAEEAYLLEALARLLASSWKARERGMRVMYLFLRTLAVRIRMDRVDPREKLLEQKAEAQRSTKDRRKAETMKDLWNDDPTEGWNLRTARKRWMLWPLVSVLEAERGRAEPPCRRKWDRKEELSMTLLEKVRLTILLGLFGRRLKRT